MRERGGLLEGRTRSRRVAGSRLRDLPARHVATGSLIIHKKREPDRT